MMEAMQAQSVECGEDYRFAAADALKAILSGRMDAANDAISPTWPRAKRLTGAMVPIRAVC